MEKKKTQLCASRDSIDAIRRWSSSHRTNSSNHRNRRRPPLDRARPLANLPPDKLLPSINSPPSSSRSSPLLRSCRTNASARAHPPVRGPPPARDPPPAGTPPSLEELLHQPERLIAWKRSSTPLASSESTEVLPAEFYTRCTASLGEVRSHASFILFSIRFPGRGGADPPAPGDYVLLCMIS